MAALRAAFTPRGWQLTAAVSARLGNCFQYCIYNTILHIKYFTMPPLTDIIPDVYWMDLAHYSIYRHPCTLNPQCEVEYLCLWCTEAEFLDEIKTKDLKVPKCEILISWILMTFLSWSLGKGLEGWNKNFTFFTDGWDKGRFVFATACAVYASKLLPHAQCALVNCYRMRSVWLANCEHNFTRFYTILCDLLPHAQYALAIGYRMHSVR